MTRNTNTSRHAKIGIYIKGSYWNSTTNLYTEALCEIMEVGDNTIHCFECKVITGKLKDSMVSISDHHIIKEYRNFDHILSECAEYFI